MLSHVMQQLRLFLDDRLINSRLFELDRERMGATLLGASVPSVLFGNAVLAITFGLSVLLLAPVLRDSAVRWQLRGLLLGPIGAVGTVTALWWGLSSAFSTDPMGSFEVLVRILLFVGAALVLLEALANRIEAAMTANLVFLGAFAASVFVGVLAIYGKLDVSFFFRPFSDGSFSALSFFKSYMSVIAVATPVALWIGWRQGGWWFALSLGSASAGAFILLGNGLEPGRSALAGLASGALVVLIVRGMAFLPAMQRRLMTGTLAALVGGIGLAAMIALPSPPVSEADAVDPPLPIVDFHRQAIWGFVVEKAMERPVLGFGLNTINTVEGADDIIPGLNQEYVPSHPHNWMLEMLAETGIPGLILFVISQIMLAFMFAKAALKGRSGGYAALAALAAFWTSSLGNFSIWSSWWEVSFLAILILPGAPLLGPIVEVWEAREAPRLDWRRGSVIGGVVILSLLMAVVWYARNTQEGYVLYKRLKAPSPYLFEEIHPSHLATDPRALIRPLNSSQLVGLRADVQRVIWGASGLPTDLQPAEVTRVDGDPYNLSYGRDLARVERFTVPIEANYQSIGYILQPKNPTGQAVVYLHGYAGDISQAGPLVSALLRAGVTVAALNFPGYAENAFGIYNDPHFGPVSFDHDYLLYFMDRPMRAYIEPAIVAANRLRALEATVSVHVVGFSAGGWAAGVAAAVDPRFVKSASVASFLPFYLRDRGNKGEWTPPHLYAPLIKAANYLEIPLLAATGTDASGSDRAYLQIFNRYDRCCYANRRGKLYQPAIDDRLDQIGTGGGFGVAIDETHAQHMVSPWARQRLVGFLSDDGRLRVHERSGLSAD